MAGNEPFKKKWTRFCETILREEGFAKPRLMFLKFGRVRVSAPQEGAGGMQGGGFGFWRAGKKNIKVKICLKKVKQILKSLFHFCLGNKQK